MIENRLNYYTREAPVQTRIVWAFLILSIETFIIEGIYYIERGGNYGENTTIQNQTAIGKEKAVKVIQEWEEANWQHVEEREEEKERYLSQGEIEWLNEWVKDNEFDK